MGVAVKKEWIQDAKAHGWVDEPNAHGSGSLQQILKCVRDRAAEKSKPDIELRKPAKAA